MTDKVSDEEVQSSREKVEALQQELNEVNRQVAESEADRNNAIRKARLDDQAKTLEQQLEAARSRLEVSQETPQDDATTTTDSSEVRVEEESETSFPIDLGGGRYQLSDGSTVFASMEEAVEKQNALNTQNALDTPED